MEGSTRTLQQEDIRHFRGGGDGGRVELGLTANSKIYLISIEHVLMQFPSLAIVSLLPECGR